MKFLIFFCIILISSNSFCQEFQIRDKSTNNGIPFVAIYNSSSSGFYSSESGYFSLTQLNGDSVKFEHLSYKEYKTTKGDLTSSNSRIIYLESKSISLNEVVVRKTEPKTERLGYYWSETTSKNVGPGGKSEFALFAVHIKNNSGVEGQIKKVFYDLASQFGNKGGSKARIRIYTVGQDGYPDKDLLTDEIIKRIEKYTPNIKQNVEKYNISFPAEGVFVALEFFCYFKQKNSKELGHYSIKTNCPHVATTIDTESSITGESYYYTLSNRKKLEWVSFSDGSEYKNFKGIVFKFGAEVEF